MYRPCESWMIRVRTLHIFGTADTAISVGPAKDSAAWAGDYTLELLEGISHWVQEEQPDRVSRIIEGFIKEKH